MAISTQTFTQFVSNCGLRLFRARRGYSSGPYCRFDPAPVVQAASGIALWLQGEVLQTAALTALCLEQGPGRR